MRAPAKLQNKTKIQNYVLGTTHFEVLLTKNQNEIRNFRASLVLKSHF